MVDAFCLTGPRDLFLLTYIYIFYIYTAVVSMCVHKRRKNEQKRKTVSLS